MSSIEEGPCQIRCALGQASYFSELSRELIPADQWLHSTDGPGQFRFSVEAVATASYHFNVSCGTDNPLYGEPRMKPQDPEARGLAFMRSRASQNDHFDTGDIERLRELAAKRNQRIADFNARPAAERANIAEFALPFLLDVAASYMETGPLDLTPDPAAEPVKETERGRAYYDLYRLDQGPFLVARTALDSCVGPMVYTRRRLLRPNETVPVCRYDCTDSAFIRAFEAELNNAHRNNPTAD
ncbi:MAG TPA: hypothetical protein VLF71_00680 [Candidatus Saccharimonadales bacterium]|nr:hypothetical protein [Candidatus Saccharimonadales bacterium]